MPFKLIIRAESGETREIEIPESGVTLGRHASNTVQLEGAEVSRFHARVEPRGERVLLTDRESYGGTWIDGALLDGSFELAHGDRFDIGTNEVFVVDRAKSFTLPKHTPRRDDDEDEEDGGSDDFLAAAPPPPRPVRVISSQPAADEKTSQDANASSPVTPATEGPSVERDAREGAKAAPEEIAHAAPAEAPGTSARPSDAATNEEAGEGGATPPADATPLPEFKITASADVLTAALARAGRTASRQHHRIVFVAPEPPRDPIGMRRAPITFGTDPERTIVIAGEGTQPLHATIAMEEGVAILTAAEGATVKVNGAPATRHELLPGDRVEMGDTVFVAASRAREHYTPPKGPGWAASVVPFAPERTNARAWLFAVLILAAGVGGMLFLLLAREPAPPPERPVTLPIASVDAGTGSSAMDVQTRDVPIVLTPTEIQTRLDEARADVDAFETQSALARLAVFHGRTDLPAEARVRAAMIEVSAYVADGRPEDAARACAMAIEAANGDTSFLADESPRVRSLCGVVARDDGGATRGATARRDR